MDGSNLSDKDCIKCMKIEMRRAMMRRNARLLYSNLRMKYNTHKHITTSKSCPLSETFDNALSNISFPPPSPALLDCL
jgi:hypothetical protein